MELSLFEVTLFVAILGDTDLLLSSCDALQAAEIFDRGITSIFCDDWYK